MYEIGKGFLVSCIYSGEGFFVLFYEIRFDLLSVTNLCKGKGKIDYRILKISNNK